MDSLNAYVRRYLGSDLPYGPAHEVDLDSLGIETRKYILRMLDLMRRSGLSATDLNPSLIWEALTVIPRILPGSLDGMIPPFTNPGRHEILDSFVGKTVFVHGDEPGIFVDAGCGFPPFTTVETARNLPGWNVFGIDQNFAPYIVIDPDGHYACFGNSGSLQYMHPKLSASDTLGFYKNKAVVGDRFKAAFAQLSPMLKHKAATETVSVEHGGFKLKQFAIREYETRRLAFLETGLEDCSLRGANVVRCMNLLVYFDVAGRVGLTIQAGKILDEGGIFLFGTNHAAGLYRRYLVYKKQGVSLLPEAFAFSLDVLRPLSTIPWYTIHENDPEAAFLAELTGTIRRDETFWRPFSKRADALFEAHGVCRRDENGFLTTPEKQTTPAMQIKLCRAVWRQLIREGSVDKAVDALCKAGYNAFRNTVDDIAIRPEHGLYFPSLSTA